MAPWLVLVAAGVSSAAPEEPAELQPPADDDAAAEVLLELDRVLYRGYRETDKGYRAFRIKCRMRSKSA